MELLRLHSHLAQLDEIGPFLAGEPRPVLFSCADANNVMIAAALREVRAPSGVWLEVSREYLAQLAARDVATLSWLITLEHVVVAGEHARAQAEVVRALLSDDEVNLDNEVATLRGAYNRPAPPRPVTVWSFDGEFVRADDVALRERSREDTRAGVVTRFA